MIRFRTNAKINLFLRVLGRRKDGFHEIETVFHGIGLGDDITITPTETKSVEVSMALDGIEGEIPEPKDNLVRLSADALLKLGAINPGIAIEIKKRIPISAGLGGGSGNAAGVLVLLNELWGAGHDAPRLLALAGGIGADIPYCIGGGTVLGSGKGEKLTRIPAPATMWFVLGITSKPLSTAAVYGIWREGLSGPGMGSAPLVLALGEGDTEEAARLIRNDLEPPAFTLMPELAEKKLAMIEAGALGAALSGSGPTIYGVARDEAHAEEMAAEVGGSFDETVVVSSRPTCIERLDS